MSGTRRTPAETLVGALVIAVAAAFFVFAYTTAGIDTVEGYRVTAKFDRIDGIRQGSDVRMSGIRIGSVLDQSIDPRTYLAVVTMSIDPAVRLPEDSSASVSSDGLLGGAYLALTPGGAEETIPDGGEIEITQGSVDLLSLLLRYASGRDDAPAADAGQ